ncbi:uncharacterized protein LOC134802168 [Cydia splendana]|uniref:uncharacterized protein LOC134802168 n=1 Tax=Cydia splendana TaxID=1100963 RepID=UPI00300D2C39
MGGLSITLYLIFIFYVAWTVGLPKCSDTCPAETSDLCVEIKDSSGKVFKCATMGPTTDVKNHIESRTQSKQEKSYDFLIKPTRTQRIRNEEGKRFKRYRRSIKREENLQLDMGLWALGLGNETDGKEPISNGWRSIEQQRAVSSGEDEDWGRLDIRAQKKEETTYLYDFLIKPTRTQRIRNEEGKRFKRYRRSLKEGEENLRLDKEFLDPVPALRRTKRSCRAL